MTSGEYQTQDQEFPGIQRSPWARSEAFECWGWSFLKSWEDPRDPSGPWKECWSSMTTGWLVGGEWWPWILNFPRNIGFLIIPIDELIFFRGVAQPPTSNWLTLMTSETSNIKHLNRFYRPPCGLRLTFFFWGGNHWNHPQTDLFQVAETL